MGWFNHQAGNDRWKERGGNVKRSLKRKEQEPPGAHFRGSIEVPHMKGGGT